MKRLNKIISLVLALLMVVSMMPITANADAVGGPPDYDGIKLISGDYEYAVLSETNKTCLIESYFGTATELIIPEKINGYSVIRLYDESFAFLDISSVKIPDSVLAIGSYVFVGCNNLKSVTIPRSVEYIGYGSFNCVNLTEIIVDGNNQHYSTDEYGVLFNKNKTQLVSYPLGNVRKSYEIPSGVTTVCSSAFEYNQNLTSITIPNEMTTIEYGAFDGCYSLTEVYYNGTEEQWYDMVSISGGNDSFLNATIHFNSTSDEEGTYRIIELSSIDYLAFSQLSYYDLELSKTIKEALELDDKWSKEWENDILYSELCSNIADWKVHGFFSNEQNGFAAYAFSNDYDEIVIAYRGSRPLGETWNDDTVNDWLSDILMIVFNSPGNTQFFDAINFFEETVGERPIEKINTTGHSLGGAWANIVSAYSGCYCESFNAISALDVVYKCFPEYMGKNYNGIDNYNFIDHINQYDSVAGAYGIGQKRYQLHKSNYNFLDIANHSLHSFVVKENNALKMTDPAREEYIQTHSLLWEMQNIVPWAHGLVYWGVSNSQNELNKPYATRSISAYGGNMNDDIKTGVFDDTLIGGKGNDLLDGGYGDDSYYYFKGDGVDFIWDIDGEINVYLYGFNKNDKFEGIEHPGNRWLYCNDELILMISEENPINIYIYNNYTCEEDKELIKTIKYNSKSYNPLRWLIACPVNVEIVNDANNEVVYTLYDGTEGTYYTEYGYFYVYQDENGDYVKIADLYEGYSIRIIGTDTGTMDVSVSDFASGEDKSTFSAVNVPVTSSLVATIEEVDNEKYLVIDSNGDGNIDNRVQLVEEKEYNFTFSIQSPSKTEIRNKDGIILHANVEGNAPIGSYVKWESSNGNFDEEADGSKLKIIAKNKGWTTFTAILYDADGNELARDRVEMHSKSGFFDKIGGFFRSLFGMTKIHEN